MLNPGTIPEYWPYYFVLIFLIALSRIIELSISLRNERKMKQRGGVEKGEVQFIFMKILHFSWFLSCILESLYGGELVSPFLLFLGGLGLIVGAYLRANTMKRLGDRWSAKIFIVPNEEVVKDGLYKYLRHPNYLGVVIEIISLPLIFSAYKTAIIYSVFNAFLLFWRIHEEEKQLSTSSNYLKAFQSIPRLLPKLKSSGR